MGSYHINNDGSVSQSVDKTINNIVWIDYAQYKGKISIIQILTHILFLFPIYGWLLFVLSWCCIRFIRGYWPFFGIQAIEDTDNPIKIYCNKDGKLGLYARSIESHLQNLIQYKISLLMAILLLLWARMVNFAYITAYKENFYSKDLLKSLT